MAVNCIIMSFIYFFILSISARDSNSPQDDAELVRVPLRRNEPDPDFKDFTGVIDTGDGTPPYPFLQERPTGISFGILGSFDGKSLYIPHRCHMPHATTWCMWLQFAFNCNFMLSWVRVRLMSISLLWLLHVAITTCGSLWREGEGAILKLPARRQLKPISQVLQGIRWASSFKSLSRKQFIKILCQSISYLYEYISRRYAA